MLIDCRTYPAGRVKRGFGEEVVTTKELQRAIDHDDDYTFAPLSEYLTN